MKVNSVGAATSALKLNYCFLPLSPLISKMILPETELSLLLRRSVIRAVDSTDRWCVPADCLYDDRLDNAHTAADRQVQHQFGKFRLCCRIPHRMAAGVLGQSFQPAFTCRRQLCVTGRYVSQTFGNPRRQHPVWNDHSKWHARDLQSGKW